MCFFVKIKEREITHWTLVASNFNRKQEQFLLYFNILIEYNSRTETLSSRIHMRVYLKLYVYTYTYVCVCVRLHRTCIWICRAVLYFLFVLLIVKLFRNIIFKRYIFSQWLCSVGTLVLTDKLCREGNVIKYIFVNVLHISIFSELKYGYSTFTERTLRIVLYR